MKVVERGAIERTIVEHIVNTEITDIPLSARQAACKQMLWCIGTGIAGAAAPGSLEMFNYVKSVGGNSQSTVFGYGDRIPTHLAGLANATFAKALEYEDKLWVGTTHGRGIGFGVIPTALAVAEAMDVHDSAHLVAAIAIASDINGRLLRLVPDASFGESPWNSTYVLAVFGSVVSAAKLMGLTAGETQNAMGLAFAQAAGNYQGQIEGVLGVRLQAGFAVRNGIMSAELAKAGLTGVQEFVSGDCGLLGLFYPGREVDWESFGGPLGEHYMGEDLGYKAYPCGLVAHGAIDALRGLAGRYDLEDVAQIRVYGDSHLGIMAEPREFRCNPRNFVEAQFSIPWALACVAIDGNLRLEHFSEKALEDNRYRRVAQLVQVNAKAGRKFSAVELELKDGKIEESNQVLIPHGHPSDPLSRQEMIDIFADCVAHGPHPGRSAQLKEIAEIVLCDDGLPDMDRVMKCLRAS